MIDGPRHVAFDGRLVILGFGCIAEAALPLLLRHVEMPRERFLVASPSERGAAVTRACGVHRVQLRLTPANLDAALQALLRPGDFLLNLSVDVSSVALVAWCQAHGVLYLDTCIEPWAGAHADTSLSPDARSNHALREAVLALRRPGADAPTALPTHGANPGLVSHFVKRALLDMAPRCGGWTGRPEDAEGWARLARYLGVRTIHVAERDTQTSPNRKRPGEFVNTWSAEAFIGEASQPAELGWGTHEHALPQDGRRHAHGSPAAIYLLRPGAATLVHSWTPLVGPQLGFLITHGESISIADHLTLRERGEAVYRPTVHYAYRPCDDAVLSLLELADAGWRPPPGRRVLKDDIDAGVDELGVLLMGCEQGAYWYGSRLSIERARELAPYNSATSLQVAAGVMAGTVWVMRHPRAGIVEPDDLPFDEVLALAEPYLGEVFGQLTRWTPLDGRGTLFPETLDRSDPWQFTNLRVA